MAFIEPYLTLGDISGELVAPDTTGGEWTSRWRRSGIYDVVAVVQLETNLLKYGNVNLVFASTCEIRSGRPDLRPVPHPLLLGVRAFIAPRPNLGQP